MDDIAVGRLREAVTPTLILGVSEVMDDVLRSIGSEATGPGERLYAMGMEHFKERALGRLRMLLLERELEEAVAALTQTSP